MTFGKHANTRNCPNCDILLTPFIYGGKPKKGEHRGFNWKCKNCGYIRISQHEK